MGESPSSMVLRWIADNTNTITFDADQRLFNKLDMKTGKEEYSPDLQRIWSPSGSPAAPTTPTYHAVYFCMDPTPEDSRNLVFYFKRWALDPFKDLFDLLEVDKKQIIPWEGVCEFISSMTVDNGQRVLIVICSHNILEPEAVVWDSKLRNLNDLSIPSNVDVVSVGCATKISEGIGVNVENSTTVHGVVHQTCAMVVYDGNKWVATYHPPVQEPVGSNCTTVMGNNTTEDLFWKGIKIPINMDVLKTKMQRHLRGNLESHQYAADNKAGLNMAFKNHHISIPVEQLALTEIDNWKDEDYALLFNLCTCFPRADTSTDPPSQLQDLVKQWEKHSVQCNPTTWC
eukprot:TRINITY_DN67355_c2_g2_i2.p1 TRINITY_DN67355_c2_g2~~TRINITY_DN67355_c2_g2_i2.p1  ORF type:complete len:377 (-),score=-6.56 TRINITY_DN67355_c2_g2_i2:458-1486(-)